MLLLSKGTEQRSIVLQLERLMEYPMVRRRVDRGELALHGWHYVIEDGDVHVLDVASGAFVPASVDLAQDATTTQALPCAAPCCTSNPISTPRSHAAA